MVRTTQGSEQLDLDGMSDEKLRALQARVTQMLDERVRNRFAEYQRIARDAGYEVRFTKIGEEPPARRGRRDGEMRSRQSGRGRLSPNIEIRITRLKPGREGDANPDGYKSKLPRANPKKII